MSETKPFIHLFQTRNNYYIYDVNTNTFINIQKNIYDILKKVYKNESEFDSTIEEMEIIKNLKGKGFLSSTRVKEFIHPLTDVIESYVENAVQMLTLQITQQCNLRCSYCTYSGNYINRSHSNKEMTLETAKKGIDFLIKHSKDSDNVNVGFYGGEPLLRFDFIKECIKYAKQQGEGKEVDFTMTTNGTLLDDEKVEFLQSNNVNLTISLDGPKEVHDKNRVFPNGNGSFDKIMRNIERLQEKFPNYVEKNVRFNIVMDGSIDFCCINNFFMEYEVIKDMQGSATIVNDLYADEVNHLSQDFIVTEDYERFKVLLQKLGKLDKKYTSKLLGGQFAKLQKDMEDLRIHTKQLPEKGHHGGPCLPGVTRLFLNTEGIFYPCERVSETSEVMKIGNVDVGFDVEKVKKIMNVGKLTENSCSNCWALRYCQLCAAYADDLVEFSASKKADYCNGVRKSVESNFITYCTMREYGYDFNNQYNAG